MYALPRLFAAYGLLYACVACGMSRAGEVPRRHGLVSEMAGIASRCLLFCWSTQHSAQLIGCQAGWLNVMVVVSCCFWLPALVLQGADCALVGHPDLTCRSMCGALIHLPTSQESQQQQQQRRVQWNPQKPKQLKQQARNNLLHHPYVQHALLVVQAFSLCDWQVRGRSVLGSGKREWIWYACALTYAAKTLTVPYTCMIYIGLYLSLVLHQKYWTMLSWTPWQRKHQGHLFQSVGVFLRCSQYTKAI